MVNAPSHKNIWIAAGDGDLDRVKNLVDSGMSPNVADPNTYTPMHAAASYGHIDVLEYLVSVGGDVNVTDEDDDTPLYTVENIETARWLIEHGAEVDRKNLEGIAPAEHLEEDFPEVATYLRSLSSSSTGPVHQVGLPTPSQLQSELAADNATDSLAASLISSVQQLLPDFSNGDEPSEEDIRGAVERVVLHGVDVGRQMGESASANVNSSLETVYEGAEDPSGAKRQKI